MGAYQVRAQSCTHFHTQVTHLIGFSRDLRHLPSEQANKTCAKLISGKTTDHILQELVFKGSHPRARCSLKEYVKACYYVYHETFHSILFRFLYHPLHHSTGVLSSRVISVMTNIGHTNVFQSQTCSLLLGLKHKGIQA